MPRLAYTVEAPNKVNAAAAIEAWLADAVILVDGAETSTETSWTDTRETVYTVQTGGSISTRPHQAIIHIGLTAASRKTSQAMTCQLRSKAISILAQPAIFTWRPGDKQGGA